MLDVLCSRIGIFSLDEIFVQVPWQPTDRDQAGGGKRPAEQLHDHILKRHRGSVLSGAGAMPSFCACMPITCIMWASRRKVQRKMKSAAQDMLWIESFTMKMWRFVYAGEH